MKLKVKSELNITGLAIKVLVITVILGIIGVIMGLTVAEGTRSDLAAYLFIMFYSIFLICTIGMIIVKQIINTTTLESVDTDKTLLEILKQLKAGRNGQKEEELLTDFEKERIERENNQ